MARKINGINVTLHLPPERYNAQERSAYLFWKAKQTPAEYRFLKQPQQRISIPPVHRWKSRWE